MMASLISFSLSCQTSSPLPSSPSLGMMSVPCPSGLRGCFCSSPLHSVVCLCMLSEPPLTFDFWLHRLHHPHPEAGSAHSVPLGVLTSCFFLFPISPWLLISKPAPVCGSQTQRTLVLSVYMCAIVTNSIFPHCHLVFDWARALIFLLSLLILYYAHTSVMHLLKGSRYTHPECL